MIYVIPEFYFLPYFLTSGVEESNERQRCLQLAEEEGLDVAAVTRAVVERVRCRETTALPLPNSLAPDLAVTQVHHVQIGMYEWSC